MTMSNVLRSLCVWSVVCLCAVWSVARRSSVAPATAILSSRSCIHAIMVDLFTCIRYTQIPRQGTALYRGRRGGNRGDNNGPIDKNRRIRDRP